MPYGVLELAEFLRARRFKTIVLPHLSAAYRLARWLVRDDGDAQDLVQEACVSAFESIAGFEGENGKAWLLTIVRHACYRWLQRRRRGPATEEFDESVHGVADEGSSVNRSNEDPVAWLLREESQQRVCRALERLPPEFKEVIVLRELEGYSYREIADIVAIPSGTVMSRLARGRALLWKYLADQDGES
ncbi:MAG: sigma-70 family RNA polymerase sigma factor [Candidatus Competibacteraceae bacterium]|nr:sigma-70 family RNA polymerase sigma factor [Candidatus Competibacteraceae bacterium]